MIRESTAMTRSMILAILAFSLLILANLTLFSYFGFRTLSRKMVTERLVQSMNEAHQLINQQLAQNAEPDNLNLTRQLAPRLKRWSYFRAVVLLDSQGRVVHREVIGRQVVKRERPLPEQSSERETSIIPVANAQLPTSGGMSLALEYQPDTIDREVEALRSSLQRNLWFAVAISLLLLALGFAYVIWAYRRNQALQERARNADRLAYVGTLASGLAHEIRNPLNSMNMNVQLIQEELDERGVEADDEISHMLLGTRKEIHRLEKMVSSFLAYARPADIQRSPNQINLLVTDILDFLKPEIEAGGVKLVTQLAADLPLVSLDEGQMKQALLNVIQNGLQVLKPGEELQVQTRKAGGDKILIAISDKGPGISAEELKHIFKVFYSTKRGGTGLGLATAQRIVELHDGGIKVESEVGQGSTFTFILPMVGTPS